MDAITVNESYQFDESINWTHGRHAVKGGFGLLQPALPEPLVFPDHGRLHLQRHHHRQLRRRIFCWAGPQTLTVASPVLEQAGLQMNSYYFVQDDWKVTSRLTLNLGLRYELPLPWVHPNNYWGTLHLGPAVAR